MKNNHLQAPDILAHRKKSANQAWRRKLREAFDDAEARWAKMSAHENLDLKSVPLSPAALAHREDLKTRHKQAEDRYQALAAQHPDLADEYAKRRRLADLDKQADTLQREASAASARAVDFTRQETEASEQRAALTGALAGMPEAATPAQHAAQQRLRDALAEADLTRDAAAAGQSTAVAEQSAAAAMRLRILERAAALRAELPHPARFPLREDRRPAASGKRTGRPLGGKRTPADWARVLDAAEGILPVRERYSYDRETGTVTGPRGVLDEPVWQPNGQPGRHAIALGGRKQASVTHGVLVGYLADAGAEAVPELPPGHADRWAWPHLRLAGAIDPDTHLPLPPVFAATGEPATDPGVWAIEQRNAAARAKHAAQRRERRARKRAADADPHSLA